MILKVCCHIPWTRQNMWLPARPHPTILAQQGGRSYRIMLKLTYFWSLLPQRNKCNYFLFWGSTYFIMWTPADFAHLIHILSGEIKTANTFSHYVSGPSLHQQAESNLKDYNDASLCTNDDSGHKPLIQTHRNTAQKKKHKETFSFHFHPYHMVGCGQMFRVHRVFVYTTKWGVHSLHTVLQYTWHLQHCKVTTYMHHAFYISAGHQLVIKVSTALTL